MVDGVQSALHAALGEVSLDPGCGLHIRQPLPAPGGPAGFRPPQQNNGRSEASAAHSVKAVRDFAPAERNLIRLTFLDDAYRALYEDWPRAVRECVAVLRMEAGRHPKDQALAELIGELSLRDRDFRTWWASHRVRGSRQLTKTYLHPVTGGITLDVQQFSVDTQPDQQLVAYTAPPGSPSQEALRFLLQWAARSDQANDRPATQDSHRGK